jgi:hypothetical protein
VTTVLGASSAAAAVPRRRRWWALAARVLAVGVDGTGVLAGPRPGPQYG